MNGASTVSATKKNDASSDYCFLPKVLSTVDAMMSRRGLYNNKPLDAPGERTARPGSNAAASGNEATPGS